MKTRFAPSPTGFMHLGNVRTALFSALLAHSQQGEFLLRIEDTDLERSAEKYTQGILDDLKWLGLHWQEGPHADQGNGPYFQSQRTEIYNHYYQKLEELGYVYPCFCSERQLAVTRKSQLAAGQPPRYTRICAALTPEEIQQKRDQGILPTLRFRVPDHKRAAFTDLVKGDQDFATDDIGDFIIRRADGSPSFMFCNAIDDALMGVTHVVRGEDHLTNTPRQLMILRALGLPEPQYAHISLIMGSEASKLSKREGSSSLQDMRAKGFLPEALVNYLARLGHYYPENHFMALEELASKFKAENLSHSAARFDDQQLLHWQKEAMAKIDENRLWDLMGESVHTLVPAASRDLFIKTVAPNVIFPEEGLHWAKIFFGDLPELDTEKFAMLQEAGDAYFNLALKQFGENAHDLKALLDRLKTELGVKGKALYMPLRIALTGEMHGPELANIFELLGSETIKKRFETVLQLVR